MIPASADLSLLQYCYHSSNLTSVFHQPIVKKKGPSKIWVRIPLASHSSSTLSDGSFSKGHRAYFQYFTTNKAPIE
ncbi:uncharacterized protein LAJ45_00408 [Morchella importuna]|uniref:uncharacterized protein n=1 Tax=Morchella importuna TaxID=1174673 RepID=UPI001E8E4289|nr:uncharacterized protein LAJ45_00408 [Morchella importuna]KAH8155398.1 hypothetical protein LAJ45_00408 [Morchella importuna]